MGSVEKRLRQVDLSALTRPELTTATRDDFHEGIELFNAGEFWEAHETWERVWLHDQTSGRVFFQGLIQVAAGMHQVRRGIYHGADKHIRNAIWKLKPFQPDCLGVDVSALLQAVQELHKEVRRLGPGNLQANNELLSPEIILKR